MKLSVSASVKRLTSCSFMIFFIGLIAGFSASPGFAQDRQTSQDLALRPIFVTTRVFQMRAGKGGNRELTDQIFKMRTASLNEYDKWINAFKKTYPGFEIALLKTEMRSVFRTSKPAIMTVARHVDGRNIELLLNGAQSPGNGETPGTSLGAEIDLSLAGKMSGKPATYSIQQIEVESGMTYFYAVTTLKLGSTEYVKFFRPKLQAEVFGDDEYFLLFCYSVDLDKTVEPARYLDERQSLQLQEKATKKVQPEIRAGLRNLGGFIRVRVEISPEGTVDKADIQYSSFPEINGEALTAARQWVFPTTLFADDKKPITGFIAFSFTAGSASPPAQ